MSLSWFHMRRRVIMRRRMIMMVVMRWWTWIRWVARMRRRDLVPTAILIFFIALFSCPLLSRSMLGLRRWRGPMWRWRSMIWWRRIIVVTRRRWRVCVIWSMRSRWRWIHAWIVVSRLMDHGGMSHLGWHHLTMCIWIHCNHWWTLGIFHISPLIFVGNCSIIFSIRVHSILFISQGFKMQFLVMGKFLPCIANQSCYRATF
mmetsp:Transcript_16437/g.20800  ORF Transcript_16437/g.20800 Transcript_16437/m.20800 type:complete len:202 (-) Transcript_16437:639-1244(-)